MTKGNLYTRTGDLGETSLVGGERVSKTGVRLEAYGTLDEFSSFLGVVLSHRDCPQEFRGQLLSIQNELFNLGAYLATASPSLHPSGSGEASSSNDQTSNDQASSSYPSCGITPEKLADIEGWIDALDDSTPKIRAFVLPGGCELSAHTHVARTVCRRAERRILALAAESYVDPALLAYVNRLSDYLFILARHFNHLKGVEEIVWSK